jgi:hypothetical protein
MGAHVGIYPFPDPRTDQERQEYVGEVFICPEAKEWTDERNAPYGYNHQFLGNSRTTGGKYHNFPVGQWRLQKPAQTVTAMDCMGTAAGVSESQRLAYSNDGSDFAGLGNHGWTLDPPRLTAESDIGTGDAGSPRAGPAPRHGENATAIFTDGHGLTTNLRQLGYRVLGDGSLAMGTEGLDDPPTNLLFGLNPGDEDPPDRPLGAR